VSYKDLPLSFGKKKAGQRKPVWDEAAEVLTKKPRARKNRTYEKQRPSAFFWKKESGAKKTSMGQGSRSIDKKPRAPLVKCTNRRHFTQLYDVIAVGPLRQG
jgi:hypothetical protein